MTMAGKIKEKQAEKKGWKKVRVDGFVVRVLFVSPESSEQAVHDERGRALEMGAAGGLPNSNPCGRRSCQHIRHVTSQVI
jgi:hypothetical protein